MANKRGIFSLISLLTYKKPKEVKSFYIPETEDEEKKDPINQQEEKRVKTIKQPTKRPTPVSEIKKSSKRDKRNNGNSQNEDGIDKLSKGYDENLEFIKNSFNEKENKDIIIREFTIAGEHKAFLAFIDGMTDRITINDFILRPLLSKSKLDTEDSCSLDKIIKGVIETNQTLKVTDPNEVIFEILNGNTCLYVDGCDYYISSETKGYEKRSVTTPQTEGVVRGSQEGFTENLRTNVTLVRKIIRNKDLSTEFLKIGKRNHNQCAVMYIKGLTNPAIVEEVKRRIKGLSTDFIAGSGILEQFIEENPMSIIPTILTTERPDRVAANIIEGRVAIIADGSPFVLVVPVSISSIFQTPEDTNLRWQYGALLRIIRVFAVFIATFTPGLYVALTNFHREMIPTDLLIAIAKARENVPFPTIIEVLLMELSFELIREAGIRIPGIIGNTIGIIGALILGQAAVQANLVSPVLIIIVALTGLGNFAIPDFGMAFAARIIRIGFIILGALLGFYGISLGIVAAVALLSHTKSFGVPFLTFYGPKVNNSNDLIIRMPVWKQQFRPDEINPLDITRQKKISRTWTREKPASDKKEEQGEEENEDD